jgi:hypothetical protein
MTKINGIIILKSDKQNYIKIKRNQLLILESLMNDGGFNKKYKDRSNKLRYSEHSGNLGLTNSSIDRIIVSTKTDRQDKEDIDILLPHDLVDSYEYKYLFHTHPPTPKPGGRAIDGILYEFPSISDIFHFIDHYNMGNTLGSIVVTAEGYYIIYPKKFSIKKIRYDTEIEDKIMENMESESSIIQELALKEYGNNFTEDIFYNKIAKNKKYLKMFNKMINKYLNNQIKIKIKNKDKDKLTNEWLINNLYLPI